jgi:hypothetical protein
LVVRIAERLESTEIAGEVAEILPATIDGIV